ncbi:unnamed protein product [Rotaria sp. Silwood1]|nr:unnamed protein product [Rotaria sp. Silwood1]CAF0954687.1 unnamed protein product [Rotaria sp. Silwood1]CAF3355341.1 unnamed protein product [Rotaria sp. Silwood1]CAF3420958.1 unnamed protein product [Rotaria sp. Silwood1]CAF4822325.1 unnamed protein product [Rotaria sp. Silwood1]
MAASSRSATVAELRRMFSNLDSTVIESVLAANNGQVDITIDHLLTMSIDTENENNIQQVTPTTPLRQLPAVPNIYDDDPPPYPGHDPMANHHSITTTMPSLPQRSSSNAQSSISYNQSNNMHFSKDINSQQDLQMRRWKTAYDQYRICYIGDLPDDFLRVKLLSKFTNTNQLKNNFSEENGKTSRYIEDERFNELFHNEEFLNELRHNKEFLTALHSDQSIRSTSSSQQRRSFNYLSTKPLPLPTPPTVETLKTPKVRARMLQNVLTQIEQGQTMKTSMVPEESITQNESYSYGKDNLERIPLPPAAFVSEFDPLRLESNEEFIDRLKNMGKNSMEKFNQLARRFSTRKDTTTNTGKYSKQSIILLFPPLSSRHRLLLHRLRDKNYSNLFSFSVGDEKAARRTIICLKSQVMDETNVRRPDQALYKPPRRSKNSEVSSSTSTPTPPPSTTTSLEEVQQNNSTPKSTKSKIARPSAEPYVPPSRRSQPVTKEPLPPSSLSVTLTTENKKEDGEIEEEEEWEKILDSNENPQYNDLVEEIQTKFKENVQIKKPTNDYSQWSIDDIQIKEADLAHVVEVSNFPSTFRTEDLSNAFKTLTRSTFDIKWVDETHALIVFPDANMALDALQMEYPMLKVCSMSQASSASKKKAKNSLEFLQPYKTRPQTSSLTANRRICAALGLKNPMSSDKTKTERQKIETARKQKIRDKEEQQTVWDGGVLPTTSTT